MIYANDQWIQLPVKDLYDTQMMLTSINVAKDLYEKGLQEIKDFKKEYGDFLSPIQKDMDWHNQNVTGRVRDVINNLYANGIDPLRSAEGRAAVSNIINNIDTGRIARNRVSAANAEEYLKNRAKLEAAGKYNPDFEENFLNVNLKDFSSEDGIWNRLSPAEFQTLKQLTEPWYNNRTAGELNEEDVKMFGLPYNPRNKYTGFGYRQLLGVAEGNTPGWQGSIYADYYRDLAKKQLQLQGIDNPTSDLIEKQLQRNVAIANEEWLIRPTSRADEWAMLAQEQANKIGLENLRFKHAMAEKAYDKKNSKSKSDSDSSSEKESLSDAQYQLMRGTAHIISGTMFGRAAGISTYRDFSPNNFNGLLTGAQQEIADKFYTNNISDSKGATLTVKQRPMFTWDSKKGRLVANSTKPSLDFGRVNISSVASVQPALNKNQRSKLKEANKQFINAMSIDYTPTKFAQWTTKKTHSSDNSMILISNDDDAVRRLYCLDEIALNSYGVNRPQADLDWAKRTTNSDRKSLNGHIDNLYMKSTGTMFPHVENDGSVHMYQIVNIYLKEGKQGSETFKQLPVGKMGYDMGITTYSNPNFNIAGDTSTNLYFDENVDADVRWSGDQNVLHWEHVGAPQINSTIAYPQLPTTPWGNNN